MGLVVVVFLNEQFPVPVGFLQRLDLLRLAFRNIGVNQTVVSLDFPFALARCRQPSETVIKDTIPGQGET